MRPSPITYLGVNLCYLSVSVLIVLESTKFAGEGRIVPLVIGIPTVVMIAIALWARLRVVFRDRGFTPQDDEKTSFDEVASWPAGLTVVGWITALFLLVLFFGFEFSIPIYTLFYLVIQGRASWSRSFTVAGCLWLLIYLSFDILLNHSLFPGIFFGGVLPPL